MNSNILETKRFANVKLAASLYPAFSEASLRWLIFNEKTNGFDQCVRRIGRKVLINLDEFEHFLDSGGTNVNEPAK